MNFDHLKHFTIEMCSNPDDGEFYQLRCDEPAHDNIDVDQNSTLLQLAAVATGHWVTHVDDEQQAVMGTMPDYCGYRWETFGVPRTCILERHREDEYHLSLGGEYHR